MCMIVERNDRSTTEEGRKIPLFAINYETMQVLKWILVEVEHWNWLLKKLNELLLKQSIMKNMISSHNKLSRAPPDLDMFPMVERRDLKTINVKMQAMNNGDILIPCNIIRYIGWWWKCF